MKPFSCFCSLCALVFSTKVMAEKRKSGRFASQINRLCNTKRPLRLCKTIGIAVQNDNFYIRSHVYFLHIPHSKHRNKHTISRLALLTHTYKKYDYKFYFSFFGYSQRGYDANIVHLLTVERPFKRLSIVATLTYRSLFLGFKQYDFCFLVVHSWHRHSDRSTDVGAVAHYEFSAVI